MIIFTIKSNATNILFHDDNFIISENNNRKFVYYINSIVLVLFPLF
jgi:hypothetical protein